VAGVKTGGAWFPVTPLHFVWQAWRLGHRPSFCVAGVRLGDTDFHSVWQAWHLWHWAGSGGALGSR